MREEDINREELIREAFFAHVETLDTDLGDDPEDYGPWLEMFEAGWNACGRTVARLIKEANTTDII